MGVDNEPRKRVLVLTMVLVLLAVAVAAGVMFLMARRDAASRPTRPLDDAQSKAQVLGPAREIVGVAGLHVVSASYILMSCTNETDPPYQGAIYVTFDLPDASSYLDQVAADLISRGWRATPQPVNALPGTTTVSKDTVTATLHRDPDRRGEGVMKIYGECRNIVDHRNDTTGWVDVADEFR